MSRKPSTQCLHSSCSMHPFCACLNTLVAVCISFSRSMLVDNIMEIERQLTVPYFRCSFVMTVH